MSDGVAHALLPACAASGARTLQTPQIFNGYGLELTYKLHNCFRQLCEHYGAAAHPWSLVQIDDDVRLRSELLDSEALERKWNVTERNYCDRTVATAASTPDSEYVNDFNHNIFFKIHYSFIHLLSLFYLLIFFS